MACVSAAKMAANSCKSSRTKSRGTRDRRSSSVRVSAVPRATKTTTRTRDVLAPDPCTSSKVKLQALILDALQKHLSQRQLARGVPTSPQDNSDVHEALRQACIARLAEMEDTGEASPVLVDGLRRFVAALDGKPPEAVAGAHIEPLQQARANPVARRTTVVPARVKNALAQQRQADASQALRSRLLEFDNFMRCPENSLHDSLSSEADLIRSDTGNECQDVLREALLDSGKPAIDSQDVVHEALIEHNSAVVRDDALPSSVHARDEPLWNAMSTEETVCKDGLRTSSTNSGANAVSRELCVLASVDHSAKKPCVQRFDPSALAMVPEVHLLPQRSVALRAAKLGVGSVSAAAREELLAELSASRPLPLPATRVATSRGPELRPRCLTP